MVVGASVDEQLALRVYDYVGLVHGAPVLLTVAGARAAGSRAQPQEDLFTLSALLPIGIVP